MIFPARYWLFGIGALMLLLGVQSNRLDHTKGDLKTANANLTAARTALIDPKTRATWQSQYLTCHASEANLLGAVEAGNAASAAMKADTDARAKMLADGLQQARRGRAGAEARASALLTRPPAGIDACARAEAARDAVIRSLR